MRGGGSLEPQSQLQWAAHEPRQLGPAITPEQVMGASRTFSVSTVSAYDGMHPHHFSLLRHGGLAAVAVLLQCIEAQGAWPRQVAMVMTVLLPKPNGGWRVIGLVNGLYRIWPKIWVGASRSW